MVTPRDNFRQKRMICDICGTDWPTSGSWYDVKFYGRKAVCRECQLLCVSWYFNKKKNKDQYAQSVRKEMFTKEELELLVDIVSEDMSFQYGNMARLVVQSKKSHLKELEKRYKSTEKLFEKLTELTNILEEK